MWQAEADRELKLFALPATAVGQLTLTLANLHYSTVIGREGQFFTGSGYT